MKPAIMMVNILIMTGFVCFGAPLQGTENHVRYDSTVLVSPDVVAPGEVVNIYYENPDFADRDVYIHYGFNGWNLPTEGPGSGTDVISGNKNWFIHKKMSPNLNGWKVQVRLPPEAEAIHYVFCVESCDEPWDNNGGLDYGKETIYPYIGPLLTWNDQTDPASGVVLSFFTGDLRKGFVDIWNRRDRRWQRFEQDSISRDHRFVFTGLSPGSTWYYRVGDESGALSEVYQFRTMSENTDKLEFVLFGDSQDDGENGTFSYVAERIETNHSDIDFLLSTGDLPWDDRPGDWWWFFSRAKKLLASKVLMVSAGNHDTPTPSSHPNMTSFRKYFSQAYVPGRAYGQKRVGPATFTYMNSEKPGDFSSRGRQRRWLPDALQNGAGSTWNFVLWHIPPFNAGTRHHGQQRYFRDTTEMFTEKVDWVFNGHEHLYQRMKPLANRDGDISADGVHGNGGVGYLIVPSAGVTPNTSLISATGTSLMSRDFLDYPVLPESQSTTTPVTGFVHVKLDGRHFDLKTWNMTQNWWGASWSVVDRLEYTK